ncbi:MAG: hypothetical protein WC747_02675 [Candidatus Babeliales bacterium]|jgi:hypothetical protein
MMKKIQKFLICLCITHASIIFTSSSIETSEAKLLWKKPTPLDPELLLEYTRKEKAEIEQERLNLTRTLETIKQRSTARQEAISRQEEEEIVRQQEKETVRQEKAFKQLQQ